MAGLAGLGILGLSGSASAASGDHLGESWAGTPGDGTTGLRVDKQDSGYGLVGVAGKNTNQNKDIGLVGFSDSTKGVGLSGHARAGSGFTRGLVGRVDSPDGVAVQARATSTSTGDSLAVDARQSADDGVAIKAQSTGSGNTAAIRAEVDSSNGYGIVTPDNAKVGQDLEIQGNVQCTGTKHFVQSVDTPSGPKQVTYTSIEAGEARTEVSDLAELQDGRVELALPEHFKMVTSDEEPLLVQVTPYAKEKVRPQVTERSLDGVVIEDLENSEAEYTVSYTVKGIREGFEDMEIVQGE